MTKDQMKNFLDIMITAEHELLDTKNVEYTIGCDTDEAQANFKDVGRMLGLDPKEALAVYLWKHMSSIFNYIKAGKEISNEGILGRIMDARVYLFHLACLIKEERKDLSAEIPADTSEIKFDGGGLIKCVGGITFSNSPNLRPCDNYTVIHTTMGSIDATIDPEVCVDSYYPGPC